MVELSNAYLPRLRSLEICAGAGGQALGLEAAGFEVEAAIEIDEMASATLRLNRPHWNVRTEDVTKLDGSSFEGIDLLAGGVPCPPFSMAGKQLGADDERDMFPHALRLAREAHPRAIMLENVRGLLSSKFAPYRAAFLDELRDLGYVGEWRLLNASDFGVPQLRPRSVLVAMRAQDWPNFEWPNPDVAAPTVGTHLVDLMSAGGWDGADDWSQRANRIAPTIVGGSKKHGGPDLGPTRARAQWAELGVDGRGLADAAPTSDTPRALVPRLTIRMVARLQGFPDDWQFAGRKTAQYRQVGNAFPPPVAAGVAAAIAASLRGTVPSRQDAQQSRLFERPLG